MSGSTYDEDNLPDLLPLYYNRLFPQALFHKWLCYGDPANFNKREICFTLYGDIYLRYQSFDSLEEFAQALHKKFPIKIDIGAVYKDNLKAGYSIAKTPVEREVVFDIDMTDYDEIRICCTGTDVCSKCWKFMTIACKILDAALREDFGFENILWVFSGRRGIHCWVADKKARKLNDLERSTIADYLDVIKNDSHSRRVKLPLNIHSSLQRALKIIDQYFEKHILIEQDILGDDERINVFLTNNVEKNLWPAFRESMSKVNTSAERWNAFQNTFHKLLKEQKNPKSLKHMIEEIKLFYAYPRLDINVSRGMNHLLKAPFCVHPKSGKVSVPFKAKFVDSFHPETVPTISQILDEVNVYDAKTQEQEQNLAEKSAEVQTPSFKIKDYKKTSLLKYVTVFNEFLRGLQLAAARDKALREESSVEI